jgi:hypothetical protein
MTKCEKWWKTKRLASCKITLKCKIQWFWEMSKDSIVAVQASELEAFIQSKVCYVEKECAMSCGSWLAVMWLARSEWKVGAKPGVQVCVFAC